MDILFFAHIPFVVKTTSPERLQQHSLLITTNRTDRTFFVWRLNLARTPHPGHSTILLQSEIPRSMCSFALWQQATIEIIRRNLSYYCSLTPWIYIVLHAYPICGESNNQGNTTREVATTLWDRQMYPQGYMLGTLDLDTANIKLRNFTP